MTSQKHNSVVGCFTFFKNIFGSSFTKRHERNYIIKKIMVNNGKLYLTVDPKNIKLISESLNLGSINYLTNLLESQKYKNTKEAEAANETIAFSIVKDNLIEICGNIQFALSCLQNEDLCRKDININSDGEFSTLRSTTFKM